MDDKIRLANRRDIHLIQKYIKENWSKNHIFTKDKDLFFWQHKYIDEENLNFVIAINNDNKICGVMGFITSNFTTFNKNVWTAIWHINKELCNNKNTGIKLLNFILDKFKPNVTSGTQLNQNVKNIYKFLGFKITTSDHFFLPGVNKSNIFYTKNKVKKIIETKNKSIQIIITRKVSKEIDLINSYIINENIANYNYTKSYKDKKYLTHRYDHHPKYKYSVLKIEIDNKILCQLIVRTIEINSKKVLRIIDIIYLDLSIDSEFYSCNISKFIIKNKYEYIDFVSALNTSILAEKMGFYKKSEDDIIPNNFEPFEKKNVESTIAYKLINQKEYYFFKGDADSDRPNE